MADPLNEQIKRAVTSGQLRADAADNIARVLSGPEPQRAERAVAELIEAGAWEELNDRFYKTLAFGTGGLRGRTIGKVVTKAETGTPTKLGRPEFPCVGTNTMNYENVARATRGLVNYLHKWRAQNPGAKEARPKIVIAHDSRHFSAEFTALISGTANQHGCDAVVFDGPRSTPELSFAVRYLRGDAGIVVTASHNPPQDNGYKVYFSDGAQVIEPHASGIIAEVNAAAQKDASLTKDSGKTVSAGDEIDHAYMDRLETVILNPELLAQARELKIVYTPIHGTGAVIVKPMLARLGLHFSVVAAQDVMDGRFPTVQSPNPENAEALKLAVAQAQSEKADLVIATDPDCDRMGVAVRVRDSAEMRLLTGNQIGSLIAWYRAHTLFEQKVLTPVNAGRGVIIKTFVTTDLQKAIAEKFDLRCVETLTGFKYIGAKLAKYEAALGQIENYRELSEAKTRQLRLERSSFYIFGGEESYGYSGADFVRDKDANMATIMFCEVAAYATSRGLTLPELLDTIYAEFGYFEEKNGAMVFEGADGAEKIKRLLASYEAQPPPEMDGIAVSGVRDFEKETIHDVEGDVIPKEKMLIFELADKTRIAVRGSGTEPKIKYYLFGQRQPVSGKLSAEELQSAKSDVGQRLTRLWDWLQADSARRLT
ncbi:MAG: phospho-sugar mutase [Verrucomicrobiota bacterium]